MLSLGLDRPDEDIPRATPQLLPCRVHHDGSVEPVEFFWEPRKNEGSCPAHNCSMHTKTNSLSADGTSTAYFRGRKLHGATLKLPEGYRGVVGVPTAPAEDKKQRSHIETVDLTDEKPEGTKQGTLDVKAQFDEIVIWNHESAGDATADPYLRGMEEWLALSEEIHSYTVPDKK